MAVGGHTATWIGSEMIVIGGVESTGLNPAEAAAYDPARDARRSLPPAPLEGRTLHAAVWTGSQLLVWGGEASVLGGTHTFADGAVYTPASNTWELLPTAPLSERFGLSAVWTGSEVILWGGVGTRFTPDGARLDPVTSTWTAVPPAPVERPVQYPAVWTGREMLVWAGSPRPTGVALRISVAR